MNNLNDHLATIVANLDDLQSGLEACARATDTLHTDTSKLDGVTEPLRRSVVRHIKEIRACARDQRAALRELRDSVARLRRDVQSAGGVRPPPAFAADRPRH